MTVDTLEILAQIKSDKRSLTQTLADFKLARIGLREMSAEAKAVDISLARMGTGAQSLGARLRGTTSPAIEAAARDMAELRKQALAATTAMEQAGGAVGRGSGGVSRLGAIGREITGLPSVMLPGGISSNDLGQGLRAVDSLGLSVTQLAVAGGVAIPLVAGVGFAIHELGRLAEEARIKAERYFRQQEEIAGLNVNDATTKDFQNLINDQQRQYEIAEAQRRMLRPFIEQYQSGAYGEQGISTFLNQLSAATNGQVTSISDLTAEWTRLEETSDTLLIGMENLNLSMRESQVSANDLRAVEEQLGRQRKDDLTTATLAAIAAEEARIDKLELSVTLLKAATEAAVAADTALAALEKSKVARAIDAAQQLLDAQIRIDAELADGIGKAEAKRREEQFEDNRKAALERAEAERDARLDLEKAEKEHRKNLKNITRDGNRDIEVAIGNRDAGAADEARYNLKRATDNENEAYRDRRDEINARLKETHRDIENRLREQHRMTAKSYLDQLATARDAARRALETEQSKQAQLVGIQTAWQVTAIGSAKSFAAQMNAEVAKAFSVTGSKNIPIAKVGAIPKLDVGGRILSDGLIYGHTNEVIYNLRQQRERGGVTVPVTITAERGMTPKEVGKIAGEQITQAFEIFVKG